MFTGMLIHFICYSRNLRTTQVSNLCVWLAETLWLAGVLCMLQAVYILLQKRRTWFFYALISYAFTTTLLLPLWPEWGYVVAYMFYPLCYIELMRLYLGAVKSNTPGIWILVISHGLTCLCVIFSTLVYAVQVTNPIALGQTFYGISFISPAIGFALFFAGDFARTASSLQQRMIEVENLSSKAILQEKEKMEAILEKQQAVENVRSRVSMDIHDEIGSQLTKISLLSQRIKMAFEKKKEIDADLVDKITTSSKAVVANLGEIIWTVNPLHDNLQSLIAYLRSYVAGFFEHTSVQCTINFPENVPAIAISPDVKHNLFLVIKESLNNVIKHANASAVHIDFHLAGESYCVEITDNGTGISKMTTPGFGNGLLNMQRRMEAINGTFVINSGKDAGTVITLQGAFDFETKSSV